jgi:hypothetical protein
MIEVLLLGRQYGYPSLKVALEETLDLSCFDVEALRLLLTAERSEKREPGEAARFPCIAESASDPLHRKLRHLRCLRCRFDCYRVERTSSRARVEPAESGAFSRRTVTTAMNRSGATPRSQTLNARSRPKQHKLALMLQILSCFQKLF